MLPSTANINRSIRALCFSAIYIWLLNASGLAAPLLINYTNSIDFSGAIDVDVWPTVVQNNGSGTVTGGVWQVTRGATNESNWTAIATIQSAARINLSGTAGTRAIWRTTLNSTIKSSIFNVTLQDDDASRYLEVDCTDNITTPATDDFVCNYSIRNAATFSNIRTAVANFNHPDGSPFIKGTFYDFELRTMGGTRVDLYVDNQLVQAETFNASEWNGMDWATVRWNVAAAPGTGGVVNASLDEMSYSDATDNVAPTITVGGATPGVWLNATDSVNISALDGNNQYDGSGVKCLKAQWDTAPASDAGCYTTTLANMPVNQQGSHTLYVKAWDWAGNSSTEQATYQLDTIAPTLSGTANSGCGVTNNSWQNSCADANFTWSGGSDSGGANASGIDSYEVYWGPSASGTPATPAATAAYNPGTISSGSTYYLRAIAIDNAGNQSAAATLFVLNYDNTPPSTPTGLTTGCSGSVATNVWQNSCSDPAFNWNDSSDNASGIARYEVTWDGSTTNRTTWPLFNNAVTRGN